MQVVILGGQRKGTEDGLCVGTSGAVSRVEFTFILLSALCYRTKVCVKSCRYSSRPYLQNSVRTFKCWPKILLKTTC